MCNFIIDFHIKWMKLDSTVWHFEQIIFKNWEGKQNSFCNYFIISHNPLNKSRKEKLKQIRYKKQFRKCYCSIKTLSAITNGWQPRWVWDQVKTCLFYQACKVHDIVCFGDQSANAEKSWHLSFRHFCLKLVCRAKRNQRLHGAQ